MAEVNVGTATVRAMAEGDAQARQARRSPLQGSGREQLALLPASMAASEVPFMVMADVRVASGSAAAMSLQKALGVALPGANTFVMAGERAVVWLGPDEWLVIGPDGDAELLPTLEKAVGQDFAAVVDVSGQRTTIDLSGAAVRELLAHGLAMDLHPAKAPTGTAATTVLALAGVTLMVLDDGSSGGTTTVRLLVRSSFARYLADWLADASVEYRTAG